MDPDASLFPCWALVAQMGHREVAGFVTLDASLGVPMLRVALPEAPGDEWRGPLPAAVELVAPSSLYGVRPLT